MWYTPSVDVEFTREEVDAMIELSQTHYDYRCKLLSTPGRGAILNGMRNKFDVIEGSTITERLTGTDANLLAKCCERDPAMLYKMTQVFRAIENEWNKMNSQPW